MMFLKGCRKSFKDGEEGVHFHYDGYPYGGADCSIFIPVSQDWNNIFEMWREAVRRCKGDLDHFPHWPYMLPAWNPKRIADDKRRV